MIQITPASPTPSQPVPPAPAPPLPAPLQGVQSQWGLTVRKEIGKVVVGQANVIERLLVALLVDGHVLLEGMPGLAKTLLVRSLAAVLGIRFERIQFTPDLLPSDVVGTMVFHHQESQFKPHLGPVFANLLLADEINRAPAKVQSALLEAMQERQVTIGGHSHKLPKPFFVMATQNPIEQEGTYPLPEAQLDRFLFKLVVDYPSHQEEAEMLHKWGRITEVPVLNTVSSGAEVIELRSKVDAVHVAPAIQEYILTLVRHTRTLASKNPDSGQPLLFGASPRASIALLQASKALAWLRGADFVSPDIVGHLAVDCLRHRIGLSYEAEAAGKTADDVVADILSEVRIPDKAA